MLNGAIDERAQEFEQIDAFWNGSGAIQVFVYEGS